MNYRELGRTGWRLSTISFGAWAIGGTWGTVSDDDSIAALHRALELGVNFFDTADVYGDGHSERLLARLKREHGEPFYIATKAGRRLNPHIASGYTKKNLTFPPECSRGNSRPGLHSSRTIIGRSTGKVRDLTAARHFRASILQWDLKP